MRCTRVGFMLAIGAVSTVLFGQENKKGEEDAAVPLLNGKDLDGWVIEGAERYRVDEEYVPNWTVKDGVLATAGKGYGWLRYDRVFDDFVFHVEYRMLDKRSNSGLGIRTVPYTGRRQTRPSLAAYEIQLLHDVDKPASPKSTGSLYRYVGPTAKPLNPLGEWNTFDVRCVGPRLTVTLNGQKILDFDQSEHEKLKDKPLRGYLSVQSHNGPVEFRNLSVDPITSVSGSNH